VNNLELSVFLQPTEERMVRLQVLLDTTEANLLAQLAASELRDPRDQIRLIIRQELKRRGLLPASDTADAGRQAEGMEDRQ
jgi:hypothetical protein